MNTWRQYFESFLAKRRSSNLFGRRIILDSVSIEKRAERVSDYLNCRLVDQARQELPSLLDQLGTSTQGLDDEQVDSLRAQHGLNEVEHERPAPWWKHLWLSYNNPFNLLLTLLAVVSYVTDDIDAAVVISTMVVLAT